MSGATFRILQLEDDAAQRKLVADALGGEPDAVLVQVPAGEDLARVASAARFDAVLARDPSLVARVGAAVPDAPIVLHSGGASLARAVRFLGERASAARLARGEAAASQKQIVAGVSSAVRPQVAALVDMTTLLLEGSLADDQRELVKTIRASGEHVLATLGDIADFRRIESGEVELARAPFALRDLIEETIALVATNTAEEETEIVYAIAPSAPAVILGDAGRKRRILVELISRVRMAMRCGTLRLDVTGTPLADGRSQLELALEGVAQAGASPPGELPDLSPSAQIVERMGGHVELARTDAGVRARLAFPVTVVERQEATPAPSTLGVLEGKRVLVVDDHAFGREVLAACFRTWRMRPVEAATPRLALELASAGERFDLVVLDFYMPELDGVELAKALRSASGARAVPLVLMSTAAGLRAAHERAPSLFAAFLTKPVRPSQLFNVVHDVLERAAASAPARKSERLPGAAFDAGMGKAHPLRILVAEDNATNQRVLKAMLERLGYSARFVGDGREAVEAAISEPFDLVFMDIQMPEVDGLEACRRISACVPRERRPRLVAMTAEAIEEDRPAAASAGVEGFLRKPITREGLVTMLASCRRAERRP